jgi:hypothetical protein
VSATALAVCRGEPEKPLKRFCPIALFEKIALKRGVNEKSDIRKQTAKGAKLRQNFKKDRVVEQQFSWRHLACLAESLRKQSQN